MNDHNNTFIKTDQKTNSPSETYLIHSKEMRWKARQQKPSFNNAEMSIELRKMWNETTENVKKQFKEQAAKMKS